MSKRLDPRALMMGTALLFSPFAASAQSAPAVADSAPTVSEGRRILSDADKLAKIESEVALAIASFKSTGQDLSAIIPHYTSGWSFSVLAQEDIKDSVVNVPEKSVVFVGKNLQTEKLYIHGDGILYISGGVRCSVIDVKGKALVIYDGNNVHYYGGDIWIQSGAVIAKGANRFRVHIADRGYFSCGGDNFTDIDAGNQLLARIKGSQFGNIKLTGDSGLTSDLFIGERIKGEIDCRHSLKAKVELDIEGDIKVAGDLGLEARYLKNSNLSVGGAFNVALQETQNENNLDLRITGREGKLSTKRDNVLPVYTKGDVDLLIGRNQLGNVKSTEGSIRLSAGEKVLGDLSAARELNLKSADYAGLVEAESGVMEVSKTIDSQDVHFLRDAKLNANILKGLFRIDGTGDIRANRVLPSGLFQNIHLGAGAIRIAKDNEAVIEVAQDAVVEIGEHNLRKINVNGSLELKIGSYNQGPIFVAKNAKITVGDKQTAAIYVGGDAQIKTGTLTRSITVIGQASLEILETLGNAYDGNELVFAGGSLKIERDNQFAINTTDANSKALLRVGGRSTANINLVGGADVGITRDNNGEVLLAKGGQFTAQAQTGNFNSGSLLLLNIEKQFEGDIKIATFTGTSKLNADRFLNSDIDVAGDVEINATDILSSDRAHHTVHVKTGNLILKGNMHSDFLADGYANIHARNIYGDVIIAGKNSQVKAIVNGRLKVGE